MIVFVLTFVVGRHRMMGEHTALLYAVNAPFSRLQAFEANIDNSRVAGETQLTVGLSAIRPER